MIDSPIEAQAALLDFLIDATKAELNALPDDVLEKLRKYVRPGSSPVDAAVCLAELTYARADELPAALLSLGAASAIMADENGFHDMGTKGRGRAIARELRKRPDVDAAERVSPVAPEAKQEFVPASPSDDISLEELERPEQSQSPTTDADHEAENPPA